MANKRLGIRGATSGPESVLYMIPQGYRGDVVRAAIDAWLAQLRRDLDLLSSVLSAEEIEEHLAMQSRPHREALADGMVILRPELAAALAEIDASAELAGVDHATLLDWLTSGLCA